MKHGLLNVVNVLGQKGRCPKAYLSQSFLDTSTTKNYQLITRKKHKRCYYYYYVIYRLV